MPVSSGQRSHEPGHTPSDRQPPHDLQLVIDFVNTFDAETGIDEIATPGALADWLAGRLGADPTPPLSAREIEQALRLREALRAVMLAHNGGPAGPVGAELEDAARRGPLSVCFGTTGAVSFEPRAAGFAGALAWLLVPVATAAADGTWERVKACHAEDCRWAFYDHSRNRAGRWCDMAVCGNRTKVRAYRAKRAAPVAGLRAGNRATPHESG